jgi:hypothetical protein
MSDERKTSGRKAAGAGLLTLLAAGFLFASCELFFDKIPPETSGSTVETVTMPASVHQIYLDGSGNGQVTLTGLDNNDVFLVKVNAGARNVYGSVISGSALSADGALAPAGGSETDGFRVPAGTITTADGQTLTRYEYHRSVTIPADSGAPMLNRSTAGTPFTPPEVGDTRNFYVGATSTQKPATLKTIGTYCNIWVVNANFDDSSTTNDNKVTQTQLEELAAKFDAIYPLETALLGHENGGGPGGSGGADRDPKIQILVYDIDADFGKARSGVVLGYFYSGDLLNQTYSNKAEIFYLDSEFLDREPQTIYSTLIHEFNHMINFSVKIIKGNPYYRNAWGTDTWYTEMLSMLAEDVIGPMVGIAANSAGHVIAARIPTWLAGNYAVYGPMQWDAGDALPYYASNYAFGAYLVRNFGGPALLSHIAKSPQIGRDSLDASLRAIAGRSLYHATVRFGEALVYSGSMPADVYSFDKTASSKIGGNTYTFAAFNIWNMSYSIEGETGTFHGPAVYEYKNNELSSIPPYTPQLFTTARSWLNKTGGLTITVSNRNPGVSYFVMVR